MRDHQVGVARGDVGARRAGDAHGAEVLRMVERQRALAGLRLADGDPGRRSKLRQRVGRLAVEHAAACDDQRPLRRANHLDRPASIAGSGAGARNVPHALLEHLRRIVPRFRLHVLRQRQRHRAGLGGRRQHAHRFRHARRAADRDG